MNCVDESFEPLVDKFDSIAMMKEIWLMKNLFGHCMTMNLFNDERQVNIYSK
jgi:hypothetical protein